MTKQASRRLRVTSAGRSANPPCLTWQLAMPAMGMHSVTSSPPYSAGNWQGRPDTDSWLALVAVEGSREVQAEHRVGDMRSSWAQPHSVSHWAWHASSLTQRNALQPSPTQSRGSEPLGEAVIQVCSPVLGEKTGSSSPGDAGGAGASEAAVMLLATAWYSALRARERVGRVCLGHTRGTSACPGVILRCCHIGHRPGTAYEQQQRHNLGRTPT